MGPFGGLFFERVLGVVWRSHSPSPPDAEEIAEEQNKIAAIVHLIQSDNTDVLMKM